MESGGLNAPETEGRESPAQDATTDNGQSEFDKEAMELDARSELSKVEAFFAYSSEGNTKGVPSMIQRGIRPDHRNAKGSTALHIAASTGHLAVVELLLS